MRDKPIDEMITALAASASHFVFTAAPSERAATPDDLLRVASLVAPGVPAIAVARPPDALMHAMSNGHPTVVAGSLYLAGEIRAGIS